MSDKVCMPEVVELVEALRPTGTGLGKLERLLELGMLTTTLEAFLERAAMEMPPGTMQKIKDVWGVKTIIPEAVHTVTETAVEPDSKPSIAPVPPVAVHHKPEHKTEAKPHHHKR